MDSLTQVALGGAVGYAVLGNKVGRKAILWGAILGTLPDLDVLLPYSGEVESFTYHRGFSHSLLVHLLITPVIAWLIMKLHKSTPTYLNRWFLLVFLCLSTHAILDSFTVYGTQLMWPLTEYPFAFSTIFIIDPMYTLPLLLGLSFALLPRVTQATATRMNTLGLIVSSLYICWSLAAKVLIDHKIEIALKQNDIQTSNFVSTPAPFTTFLWRIVIMSNNQYYEAYASVFDAPQNVSLTAYKTRPELLKDISDEWGVKRLQWFTKGFYSVRKHNDNVVISDLRMGVECAYVFNFVVGTLTNKGIELSNYEKFSDSPDIGKLTHIWHRVWDHNVRLSPHKVDNNCTEAESL